MTEPEFPVHPVYGGVIVPGFRPIPGFDGYEVNEYCVVRGKWGKELSQSETYKVGLYVNDKRKMMYVYHLGLEAFYPLIPTLETVDHIDDNHHNHYIGNLQWATRPRNSSKGNAGVPNTSGAARSKAVWVLSEREGERVTRYASTYHAAASCGNINVGHVSRSALSEGRVAVQGHFFVYEEQPDLPGEEWRTSAVLDRVLQQTDKPDHKKVMVSSRGRIRTYSGIKTRGGINVQDGKKSKVRHVRVNCRIFKVHQLIFMGWYNIEAPAEDAVNADGEKIEICHDDSAPLDDEGRYRNWPIDLRIDTHSENLRESHAARRAAKQAREEEGNDNISGDENEECVIENGGETISVLRLSLIMAC